ncbi:MAG: AAA family ATPase [Balneolaceae bacterium]|nr:AAA family ATPase [Balneolaceae bacterium]
MEESKLKIPAGIDLNQLHPDGGVGANQPPRTIYQEARLDINQELPPPAVAIELEGEIFGTMGNFSLVTGKAKSRKTFFVTWLMARMLGNMQADKNRIIFVDTEQGNYHALKVAHRVMHMVDEPALMNNFELYALRRFNTAERLQIIHEIIANKPDLAVLVIDGIRDLVSSINDEEQATDMANHLLRWTEENQIHILTVLHQNKGDFNARGHLGSELVNKAEITVAVAKDLTHDEISKVEAEYSRHKEFMPFAFQINEKGIPEIVQDWKQKDTGASRSEKLAPHEVDEHLHIKLLQKVKRNVDKPTYNELVKQVKLAVSEIVEKIGDNKAKDYVVYYQNENYIEKSGKDRSPKSHYEIRPFGVF